MKFINSSVLIALISALSAPRCFSQIQLLGKHLINPESAQLTDIGQQSVIYAPADAKTTSPSLYFTPFFVFENEINGDLKVNISEPLKSGEKWKVILTLAVSPYEIRQTMASELRKWVRDHPIYSLYSSTTAASLIPVELTYLSVTESDSSPVFKSLKPLSAIITQQPILLIAEFEDDVTAKSAAEKLRKRTSVREFEVRYKLYARLTTSESGVSASVISLKDTQGVLKLKGAGNAFKLNTAPAAGSASVSNAGILSRDQKTSFEAEVHNEIATEYKLENPADEAFLRAEMAKFFDASFTEKEILLDDLDKGLEQLSAYNFSPQDLTPTKIKELAAEARNAFASIDHTIKEVGGSASASFLGFGGSASGSYSKDELKQRMQDKGWKFGVDVEGYVPKSLKVYVVNQSTLATTQNININVLRVLRQEPEFVVKVSTNKGYYSKEILSSFNAGTIIPFAGTVVPPGWLLCDGDELPRADYEKLWDVIQYTYGGNPAQGSFKLPDLTGRVIIGAGKSEGSLLSERLLGEKLGEEKHTLTVPEMPKHNHTPTAKAKSTPSPTPGGHNRLMTGHDGGGPWITVPFQTIEAGESQPHNIIQPSAVINYIIKY